MTQAVPIGRAVYEEHEAAFLWDYLRFGADLRHFTADALLPAARAQNPFARRYGLLGVFREMMSAFEDFAALLLAVRRKYSSDERCPFQKEFGVESTPPFYTLVNYREMSLARTIGDRGGGQVLTDFSLDRLVPQTSDEPSANECAHALNRICNFLVTDCTTHEATAGRTSAYNKIKHGAVVISDGAVFFRGHPPGPAILDVNKAKPSAEHPLLVLTIPLDDTKLDVFFKLNWVSTSCRKIILALYLWKEHSTFLHSKGVSRLADLFDGHMWDVFRFTSLGGPPTDDAR